MSKVWSKSRVPIQYRKREDSLISHRPQFIDPPQRRYVEHIKLKLLPRRSGREPQLSRPSWSTAPYKSGRKFCRSKFVAATRGTNLEISLEFCWSCSLLWKNTRLHFFPRRTEHWGDVERNTQADIERLETKSRDEKDVTDAESEHAVEEKFTPDEQAVAQAGKAEADQNATRKRVPGNRRRSKVI